MASEPSQEKLNVSEKNHELRERSSALVREFARVVHTFCKVLYFKEKKRVGLKTQVDGLLAQVKSNRKKLEVVNHNIEVFKKNTLKVESTLKYLRSRESAIKEKYESLLSGGSLPDETEINLNRQLDGQEGSAAEEEEGTIDPISSLIRENLVKRREKYLQSLDGVFKKLEDELLSIESVQKELEQARADLAIKTEQAYETREALESVSRKLSSEANNLESGFENSVKEEKVLIQELEQMVSMVETHIEIKDQIDQILFSLLESTEPEEETQLENEIESEEISLDLPAVEDKENPSYPLN